MLKSKLKQVVDGWKKEHLELAVSCSEKTVIDAFVRIGRLISKDIIELYSYVGGMADGSSDSKLFSLWTLDEVMKENSPSKSLNSEYTYFGDWLISSHVYAFKFESINTSSVYSDFSSQDLVKVADSLEEFFDLYLKTPEKIGLF